MTMPATLNGDFDAQRAAVRYAPYTNSIEEREAIKAVDQGIFDEVRKHERSLVESARAFIQETSKTHDAVDAFAEKIADETDFLGGEALSEQEVDITLVVQSYNAYVEKSKALLDKLERDEATLVWHRDKLSDPYSDLSWTLTKFFSGGIAGRQLSSLSGPSSQLTAGGSKFQRGGSEPAL
jgi:hypothetical protein